MENSDNSEIKPYKLEQYEEFIKLLELGIPLVAWKDVAAGFGVDQDTITSWKKSPRAKSAIIKAITDANIRKRNAGKDDWRMWEKQEKLFGVDVADKFEITAKNEIVNLDNLTDDKIGQLKTILDEAGTTKGDLQE